MGVAMIREPFRYSSRHRGRRPDLIGSRRDQENRSEDSFDRNNHIVILATRSKFRCIRERLAIKEPRGTSWGPAPEDQIRRDANDHPVDLLAEVYSAEESHLAPTRHSNDHYRGRPSWQIL